MERIITELYGDLKHLNCCCRFCVEAHILVDLYSQLVDAMEEDGMDDINLIIEQLHVRVEHSEFVEIRDLRPRIRQLKRLSSSLVTTTN